MKRFFMRDYLRLFNFRGLIIIVLSLMMSCSSTKYVPEGKYLVTNVKLHSDKSINKEELKNQIRQTENSKILWLFKFHLGLYNMSSKKKDNGWLKRIGQEPVIFEEQLVEQSKDLLKIHLQNKGYYYSEIEDNILYYPKKQKVEIAYYIKSGIPYRIRNFSYEIKDPLIRSIILQDTIRQEIKRGNLFDVDLLSNERDRVTTLMQNRGYYKFVKDHIHFSIDSALNSMQVDVVMLIADDDVNNDIEEVVHHKRYKIRDFNVNTDFNPMFSNNIKYDTLYHPPYSIFYNKKLKYRPHLINNLNRIQDSLYYSLRNVERTYRSLNQIRQFRMVNLNFSIVDSIATDSIGVLDCNLRLSPMKRSGFSIDLDGTNSSGNFGVAGIFNYDHRNLFRGAEILNVALKGAMERQQALIDESSLSFNTRELGAELSLTIPKFLAPIKGRNLFNYQVPLTSFTLGYNYQRRPDYTRTISNFRYGYQWKSRYYRTHILNLVDLNYVKIQKLNPDFMNSIKDLYIKSSYTDHMIMAMNYSQTDNRTNMSRSGRYRYFRWSFESAGNLLSAVTGLSKMEKHTDMDSITGTPESYYEILNTRFAQYIKADVDYRYGFAIDKYNSIVGRFFLGVGFPYGNFDVLPFERKYFSGGANSIRGWQVRTLGPGTYKAPDGAYPNQSADIKLEANLEYRFPLVKPVEGAFFFDAGNIWAINNKDNREGAQFEFDEFYKQIAVGTGAGLRFNFDYFIFRLDLGMKLRDPALEAGRRFIIGNYPLNGSHFHLSFAIGYPF